ncbi:glutamate:Na+ symporter, ESS family [Cnuella takakiae]|uniref:Sodium/glutamate symporter n=1 Tax=Cnuella takakiae TaxID=1302690 RepID=A0A1M5BU96_9BACT|nr:sodium/glutamate symporter [Cnuella takakiae]OLY93518.1 sodium/glutamate symporter [Cnuella takakiae]SHF46078.1 glutamate:Na+ symporter, ESS family [Cnuella takakiae]
MPLLRPDLIQTLALAGLVFLLGLLLKRKIPVLEQLNIPSAVLGGLVFAFINLLLHNGLVHIEFSTALQPLCMVLFFTSIGTNASLPLLKKGGKQVGIFLALSAVFCILQNLVGIGMAILFGVSPLFGIMAGSVTLVGGPATGLAFSPLFEEMGLRGAETIAITSATVGIVLGGLLGGPAGTFLVQRFGLKKQTTTNNAPVVQEPEAPADTILIKTAKEHSAFNLSFISIGLIMGLGSMVSFLIARSGITLPAYIGAMIVGAVFRNINDKTRWIVLDQQAIDFAGSIAFNTFLVVALMDLKLWELLHLALPLAGILAVQVLVVLLYAMVVIYKVMGRDYNAAVMSGGFIGFMLGTVANAMAVMKTLAARYGAAHRAFLVVPLVGAFFIDYVNALVITVFANLLK